MASASNSLIIKPRPHDLYSHWCPVGTKRPDLQPNEFNRLLNQRAEDWDCRSRVLTQRARREPWIEAPQNCQRINEIASLAMPSDPSVLDSDQVGLTFQVPVGNDGCIVSVIQLVTGYTGSFVDGSGDLTWRLAVGQRYVPNFGNTTVQLGSLETPWQNNSGVLWLQSNQLVQYFASRTSASTGNFSGGLLLFGVFGWYWPRGIS